MTIHIVDPLAVVPTPWRNGAGATRELAVGLGPDGVPLWRVSLASLDGDAPFSSFPGLDRIFVALGPLRLDVAGEGRALTAGQQTRFTGEAAVSVGLVSPTSALNVMTRRGAVSAEVVVHRPGRPAGGDADVVVELEGVTVEVTVTPSRQ